MVQVPLLTHISVLKVGAGETCSMSGDSRKDFVLMTIANIFSIQPSDAAITSLTNAKSLNTFLDDGNCSVLAALCVEKEVKLTNKVCLKSPFF